MKIIYLLLAVAVVVFSLSVAGFLHANAPNHNTSFNITITSTAIVTKATYDPDQAPQVEQYIDSCLQPQVVFGDKHKVDKEVQISDSQLSYHIEGSPGTLNMTADKNSNSGSSLNKLKNIFEGLQSVIKPDHSNN
jgi:hypothetical protein